VTSFLGMFLPSSVGPDFMRAYLAVKYHCSSGVAVSSVFLDRFIAVVSLASVASVSCFILLSREDSGLLPSSTFRLVFGLFVVSCLAPIACKYMLKFARRIPVVRSSVNLTKLGEILDNSLFVYKDSTGCLVVIVILSFINHAIFICTVYTVILYLHLSISLLNLCMFVPLVTFVAIIPISFNGIGVQESAYIYLLSKAGLSLQESIGVALLTRIITTMGCLPGGFLYLSTGFQAGKISG
jgi:glycosyltransferase 2 family protein